MPECSAQGKSLLFLQRTFPPDPAAAGEMLRQLGGYLAGRGWAVHVACAGISLPEDWQDPPGLHVSRAKSIAYRRSSLFARALSMWRIRHALRDAARRCPRPDVVVSLTDPPGLILLGDRLARHYSASHVHWSQDVYPEIAERLQVVSSGNPLVRRLRRQSAAAMRRAHRVISLGRCMTRLLGERNIGAEKIATIPNWADPDLFAPGDPMEPAELRRRLGLPEGFLALYSGNLGLAHEFATVLDCAALLEEQHAPVRFVVAGSGPRRAETEAAAAARNLKAVKFLERLAPADYAGLLRTADLHLITLDSRIAGCLVPSKLYACLASGRASLFIGPPETEVEYTLRETGAGLCLRNGDFRGLADLLVTLSQDRERLAAMADAAAAASGNFTVETQGAKIESLLLAAADRTSAS